MNTISVAGSVSRRAGGLFESVRRLDQELMRSSVQATARAPGINVEVLGLRDEFTDVDLPAWAPVPVHVFPVRGPRVFGYGSGFSRKITELKPDLMHVHGLWQFCSAAAVECCLRTQTPYLVSPHGMLDAWALKNSALRKRLAWGAYQRRHLASAACIRALCGEEARSIRGLGLKNPICVIPNGVDVPVSNANYVRLEDSGYLQPCNNSEGHGDCCDARSASLASAIRGRRVLLYLGRLHPKKGLCELLRAWTMVPKRDDWLLVIAGWDQCDFEAKLKALASTLGLNWTEEPFELRPDFSLIFAGPKFGAAKRNLVQACHASILPSISEGLPMAVLEAWAHAKPVLMTAQCNLHEGFVAGAAIRIGPDALAIAAGLEELFRTSDCSLTEFGTRGRRLVAERYAWPAVAGHLSAVYHWMLGTGSRPSCVLND